MLQNIAYLISWRVFTVSLALIGHTRKIGQNHLSGSSNAVFMHDYTKFINHAGRFPIAEKMAVVKCNRPREAESSVDAMTLQGDPL